MKSGAALLNIHLSLNLIQLHISLFHLSLAWNDKYYTLMTTGVKLVKRVQKLHTKESEIDVIAFWMHSECQVTGRRRLIPTRRIR